MGKTKILIVILLVVILAIFNFGDFVSVLLNFINTNLEKIKIIQAENPYLVEILFFTT